MLLPLILTVVAAVPDVSTTTTATVVETPDITFVAPDTPPLGPGELLKNEPPEPEPAEPGAPRFDEPGAPRIDVTTPPPAPKPPKTRKLADDERIPYGFATAALGVLGMGITIGGGFAKQALVSYAGIATYLFGPTAVHWAHGNFEEGLAAVALYGGAPLLGSAGLVMFGLPIAQDDDAAGGLAIAGLVAGAGVAMLIDALVLAYVDEVELVPSVDIRSDRSSFGIGGRF